MQQERSGAGRPGSLGRRRSGLSLVELLVALVLLAVGLLGVAGASARAMRMGASAARERRAAQRASDRVAALASRGCAAARSGTLVDSVASMTERWTVTPTSAGVALVHADIRWSAPAGVRSLSLRSAILC
jgi:prepilin-type N-terminal cleavage/methylation domain-containing protein